MVKRCRWKEMCRKSLQQKPVMAVCDSAASLQEPLTDTWLIRLKYSWDEWACEPMSRRHDEALMAGTVCSFSFFPLILPSFHFLHVVSFDKVATRLHDCSWRFPAFSLSPHALFPRDGLLVFFSWFLLSGCRLPLTELRVDMYSNSLTILSGGRRC